MKLLSSVLFLYKFLFTFNVHTCAAFADKFQLPTRYKESGNDVWDEYADLDSKYKPLNLGAGQPDFPAPDHVVQALAATISSSDVSLNQYTRGFGHPRLVHAIAKMYSLMIGRQINPMTEVLITFGAYEALFTTILGHIGPGDEAIIIEPFFPVYEGMVNAAGGTPVFIPLRPKKAVRPGERLSAGNYELDASMLKKLFNEKTKVIILNTPNNPLGKVFKRNELELIAELCKKWNVLCISDEVYEWMVYKPNEHLRIASLPGMWDRTITIGSAGKTFSVTGWKIGWAYGPANLMRNLQIVHQNCVNECTTPIQEALARSFEFEMSRFDAPECYMKSISVELEPKKEFMARILEDVGMIPVIPEGGYLMMADWSPLEKSINLTVEQDANRDYRFTKWMTKNIGILGMPPSAFYSSDNKHLGENFVRYCFFKKNETLDEAAYILRKWKNHQLSPVCGARLDD